MNQIALFLLRAKAIVQEGVFILVPRAQNEEFMADVGWSIDDLKRLILGLDPSECFDGPEADRDPRFADNWTVAEFSPTACGKTLYLKISIRSDPDVCKCLSVKLYRERPEEEL